jgi:hypothetical protein
MPLPEHGVGAILSAREQPFNLIARLNGVFVRVQISGAARLPGEDVPAHPFRSDCSPSRAHVLLLGAADRYN